MRGFDGSTMGTTYEVLIDEVLSEDRVTAVREAVTASLDEVNDLMSTWDPTSELSTFNRYRGAAPFEVSPATMEVIQVAIRVAESSGGAFDPTVGSLVAAWGFGPEGSEGDRESRESMRYVAERRPDHAGHTRIAIDPEARTLTRLEPGIELDLSGVAKGYAVDRIAEALVKLGLSRFMVEIGGEIRAGGAKRDGSPWRVGIEAPLVEKREVFLTLDLVDEALATSGDYRNFREEGELRIGHIMDPRSARPVSWRGASVSVLHERAADADAWATALSVLGPSEGYELAEREGLAVLFLLPAEEGIQARATTAFRERTGQEMVEDGGRNERW
jgi:thiamine biosynthesis lipoprotein